MRITDLPNEADLEQNLFQNYRSSQRGRSRAEFISKLSIVQKEADESGFWLELISESNLLPKERIEPCLKEANELTAIFTTMVINAKNNS